MGSGRKTREGTGDLKSRPHNEINDQRPINRRLSLSVRDKPPGGAGVRRREEMRPASARAAAAGWLLIITAALLVELGTAALPGAAPAEATPGPSDLHVVQLAGQVRDLVTQSSPPLPPSLPSPPSLPHPAHSVASASTPS